MSLVDAVAAAGHDETELVGNIIAGIDSGVEIETYLALVRAGAAHTEILEAQQSCGFLEHYVQLRTQGYPHREAFEGFEMGIHPDNYRVIRQYGVSHAELMVVVVSDISTKHYYRLLTSGVTHLDVVECLDRGLSLETYERARKCATHDEIIAVGDLGLELRSYEYARSKGCSHLDCVAALSDTRIRMWSYVNTRASMSHQEAMRASGASVKARFKRRFFHR
jgi:hypothetical protein